VDEPKQFVGEAHFLTRTEGGLLFQVTPALSFDSSGSDLPAEIAWELGTLKLFDHVLMVTTREGDHHHTDIYGCTSEGVASKEDWMWSGRTGCIVTIFGVAGYRVTANKIGEST
jgi:hypothetical protein